MKNLTNGHKKTLYGIIIVIILLVISIILKLGTGGDNSNNKTKANSEAQTKASSSKSSVMKFSQLAYENKERLWFSFQGFTNSPSTLSVSTNLDHASDVDTLFVTKNGYITKYSAENISNDSNNKRLSIKEINNYSDKKIIEKYKELDKASFDANIQEKINNSNALNETEQAEEYKNMKYSEPKSSKMKISLTKNSADNTVTNEKISGINQWTTDDYNESDQEHNEDGTTKSPIKFKPGYFKTESLVIGVNQGSKALPTKNIVDNINFAGFGGNFVTRIEKNQSLSFDSSKDINQ